MKNQRGITLIALVVTIVVLLILAGITITYVMSDGGIFGTARKSTVESEKGAIKDYVTSAIADLYIYANAKDAYGSETTSSIFKAAFPDPSLVTAADSNVQTSVTNGVTTVTISGAKVKLTETGKEYTVNYTKATGIKVTEPAS